LRQRTNAYAILPLSQWKGYRESSAPPPPDPDTLGAPERIPDPLEAAVAELIHGQRKASLAVLEADPREVLARTLAELGRTIEEREASGVTGRQELPCNNTPGSNQIGNNRITAPGPAPWPPDNDLEAAKTHWLRVLLGTDKVG
jgi:hypothetical protein